MDNFPFDIRDVLRLEGISYQSGRKEVRVKCPVCGGNTFARNLTINLETEHFNCFAGCGFKGRGATNFYAYLHEISSKEAYENIMNGLGISKDKPTHEMKTRVYEPIKEEPQAKEASDEIKDNTYSHLFSILQLSERHKQDLLERGFTEEEIHLCGYVSYPQAVENGITKELFSIPKKLQAQQCELLGVSGFYRTKNKNVWTMQNNRGGIMIPYRDFYNRITGIQIRKNAEDIVRDPETGKMEGKYFSFSSAGYKDGCKSTVQAHYACDFELDKETKLQHPLIKNGMIAITEGALKAELSFRISNIPFIGIPGVTSFVPVLQKNIPLLKSIGVNTIAIAYDMDRVTNINVTEALHKAKLYIKSQGMKVLEPTWSKEMVNFDGTHQMINPATDFLFTTDDLSSMLRKEKNSSTAKDFVTDTLSRCEQIGRKEIFFAVRNSAEWNEDNKALFKVLEEKCKKKEMTCRPVLWSLKLKGVDDYLACKKRNVDYTTK